MTDSIYNIPDLRQKIKELTGEENFPLLREQDVHTCPNNFQNGVIF